MVVYGIVDNTGKVGDAHRHQHWFIGRRKLTAAGTHGAGWWSCAVSSTTLEKVGDAHRHQHWAIGGQKLTTAGTRGAGWWSCVVSLTTLREVDDADRHR